MLCFAVFISVLLCFIAVFGLFFAAPFALFAKEQQNNTTFVKYMKNKNNNDAFCSLLRDYGNQRLRSVAFFVLVLEVRRASVQRLVVRAALNGGPQLVEPLSRLQST